MNNKTIILSTIFFMLASSVFLSVVERRQANINTKNIWMAYFNDPKSNALDFTIENHSTNNSFHYQILTNKTVTQENDVAINNGETKTIPVSITDTANKKITISVTADNDKKEIYKNL